MADYSEYIELAKELIDDNGEATIIRKFHDGASATPWRPGTTTSLDIACVGVFFPNNGIRNPHTRQLRRKTDVAEASLLGLIPASYFNDLKIRIDITDILIRSDGSKWRITSIDDLSVDSTQTIYYQVRLQI